MDAADSNRDGLLHKEELLRLCFDTEQSFRVLDTDGDGNITFEEAKAFAARLVGGPGRCLGCLTDGSSCRAFFRDLLAPDGPAHDLTDWRGGCAIRDRAGVRAAQGPGELLARMGGEDKGVLT
jgi:hypothetical protein